MTERERLINRLSDSELLIWHQQGGMEGLTREARQRLESLLKTMRREHERGAPVLTDEQLLDLYGRKQTSGFTPAQRARLAELLVDLRNEGQPALRQVAFERPDASDPQEPLNALARLSPRQVAQARVKAFRRTLEGTAERETRAERRRIA